MEGVTIICLLLGGNREEARIGKEESEWEKEEEETESEQLCSQIVVSTRPITHEEAYWRFAHRADEKYPLILVWRENEREGICNFVSTVPQ